MADSSILRPKTSTGGIGQKADDKGQFANPPAYPDVSGFTGPSTIKDSDPSVLKLQKTPTAKAGRV